MHVRNKLLLPIIAVIAYLAAMPSVAHAQYYQQQQAPTALIRIVDAYIAPTKANGAPWDGLGHVDPSVVSGVRAVMLAAGAADVTAQIAVQLGMLINTGTQPPDVYGQARLLYNGSPYRCRDGTSDCTTVWLPKIQDDYTPIWQPTPSLPRVPLTTSLSVEIYLVDADLQNDDPIGTVVLTAQQIATAKANSGQVTHFRVDQQTHNQALYVGISVF